MWPDWLDLAELTALVTVVAFLVRLRVGLETTTKALEALQGLPGRVEGIDRHQTEQGAILDALQGRLDRMEEHFRSEDAAQARTEAKAESTGVLIAEIHRSLHQIQLDVRRANARIDSLGTALNYRVRMSSPPGPDESP